MLTVTVSRPAEEARAEPVNHEGHSCPNRRCDGEETYCDTGYPFTHHTHRCEKCGCVWQHGPGGK